MSQARTTLPHRERMLSAGESLMVEYGNFDFGVREVVEHAQVSLRTFYQHFDTRDDFALAIYAEMIRQAAEAIDRTMPKGSATTKFRHFVHSMVCPHEWNRLLAEYSAEAMQRSRALVREGFHLREARPDGYQAAVAPLREILASILGAESDDLSRNVSVVINSLITETYDVIVQDLDAEAVAEHLYRYHQRALGL